MLWQVSRRHDAARLIVMGTGNKMQGHAPARTSAPSSGTTSGASAETSAPTSYRIITRHELRALVPYTPQHVLRLEKRGLFPARVQIGPNRVGWLQSEVEAWLATRIDNRAHHGPQD